MNRNLSWNSGLLDEIEHVYEKAGNNEKLQEEFFQLEKQALWEAEEACSEGGLFAAEVGQTLTSEQFQAMAEIDKETAIVMLSQKGLSGFDVKRSSASMIAKFSTQIQRTLACTILGLLNRLEKMDGSAQVTSPKWTLVLLVPLEGKKNLFRWEMLIMQLYPWISIQEMSTNEIAEQNEETIAGEYTVVKKYPSNSMVEMMFVKDKEGVLQIIKRYDIKDHANALDQVIKYYQDLSKIRHSCMRNVNRIFEYQDRLYIVQETGMGDDIASLIKNEKKISEERVIKWATQLCDFIEYLHKLEPEILLCSCINPNNFSVSEDDRIKLLDDGFLRPKPDKNMNVDTVNVGVAGFCAPEIFGGMGELDVRTDLYGLGVLMYYCVTGVNPNEPPYEMKHICEVNPALSKGMDYIIDKCTKRNPEERYQSVEELLNDLACYKELPRKENLLKHLQKGLNKFFIKYFS